MLIHWWSPLVDDPNSSVLVGLISFHVFCAHRVTGNGSKSKLCPKRIECGKSYLKHFEHHFSFKKTFFEHLFMAYIVDYMAHSLLNERETVTRGESDDAFDFERWIAKHHLEPIRQYLIKQEMTSLQTLDLNNERFRKLMSDPNVLKLAYLIPNIVSGIQSLQSLRPPTKRKQIAFTTEKETNVFLKFQEYVEELNDYEDDMKSITTDFEAKQKANHKQLDEYTISNTKQLDALQQRVEGIFEKVHEVLNVKHKAVRARISDCKEQLKVIRNRSENEANILSEKLQENVSLMEEDRKYYIDCVSKCKAIINEFDDGMNEDSKMDFK